MILEHIGISVQNPQAMAAWYTRHLGCTIKYVSGDVNSGGCFIEDSAGETILELFKIPNVEPLFTVQNAPAQVHIAFKSSNPLEYRVRLIDAGATFISENVRENGDDVIVMLRDPWGTYIQLVQRSEDINLK